MNDPVRAHLLTLLPVFAALAVLLIRALVVYATLRYAGMRNLLVSIRAALEENVGFRPLNALWRLGGAMEAWRDQPAEWGDMLHRGLSRT